MPENDNIQTEKMSFSARDFAEDLEDNNFGIQDTQLIASNDLQKFLLSDPDKVKKVEEEQKQPQQLPEEKKEVQKKPEEEKPKPDGKKALENVLFEDKDEEGDDLPFIKNNPEKPENLEDDTFQTLSRDLLRLGVFSKNDENETEESLEIKTQEEFLDRFNLEKKKGAINILENFLSQFGQEYRTLFDAVFVNGVKPQDYLQSFAKIESMTGIDLSNESNQERIVRAYYKDLKWDDTKIENKIQKLKDYGDLEDESKAYHEVLLNKERDAAAELERKKAEDNNSKKEKEIATRKAYQRILNEKAKNQEFDGLPLAEKDVEDLLSYITEKKYRLDSGELLSEMDKVWMELNRPENNEKKIKLAILLKKNLDLSIVKKMAATQKSEKLFTIGTKENKKEKEQKSFFK